MDGGTLSINDAYVRVTPPLEERQHRRVRADAPAPDRLHWARDHGWVPGTLVSLHAHPDDECIATGGVIAQAAAAGHRVVLIVGTGGEVGEVADGFLDDGETLMERRVSETEAAAEILGIARIEWLGYRDSGMVDTHDNHADGSFWSADVDEAAARVAAILRE